jgi:hypothetical protein
MTGCLGDLEDGYGAVVTQGERQPSIHTWKIHDGFHALEEGSRYEDRSLAKIGCQCRICRSMPRYGERYSAEEVPLWRAERCIQVRDTSNGL